MRYFRMFETCCFVRNVKFHVVLSILLHMISIAQNNYSCALNFSVIYSELLEKLWNFFSVAQQGLFVLRDTTRDLMTEKNLKALLCQ